MVRSVPPRLRASAAASFLHLARHVDDLDPLVEAAGRGGGGFRWLDLRHERWRDLRSGDRLVACLERHGYTACEARRSSPSSDRWRRGRHVALVLRGDEPIDDVVGTVAGLASASARGHLLVRLDKRTAGVVRPSAGDRAAACGAVSALVSDGWRHLNDAAFDRSTAVLSGVGLIALVAHVRLDPDVDCFRAAANFWRGRFGGLRERDAAPADERSGWMALLAWARGDGASFRDARDACKRWRRVAPTAAACGGWSAVLALLSGERAHVEPAGESGLPGCDVGLLVELAIAQRAASTGQARPTLVRPFWRAAGRGRGTGLGHLCARWLRACAGLENEAAVRRAIVRRDGAGILRWGLGRDRMKVLHFVPSLLQVVHEAEDEHVALAEACAWVRTHGYAQGVAVVAEPGRVVADAGWPRRAEGRAALAEVCRDRPEKAYGEATGLIRLTAPVRYGGAVIGHVVAEARADRADDSRDAVEALAALSGPALRATLDVPPVAPAGNSMPEIVGRSPAIEVVRSSVLAAARTPFPVLIEGESGTGKELVARALHRLSARAGRRFVAINCAAFTDELIEAELFGFARGAFTGAVAARPGLIEDANGGSLFLDEVGDLSGRAQAKLLRTLQEREVRRVGENTTRQVDVRVIAATNVPVAEAVAAGRFRGDLLFRLAVVRIGLPPLRDRLEDLPLLVAGFWRRAMADVGKEARLSREGLAALGHHAWPGNVRELQNVIAGLAVAAPAKGRVTAADVRAHLSSGSGPAGRAQPLDRLRRQFERRTVARALVRNAGRRSATARELGLSRQGLLKAIRRLGLGKDDTAGVA